MSKAPEYPKRPPFFAHEVVRMLAKTCAGQEIGTAAAWLVAIIAHTEDAKRYTSPPTFYNDQLLPIVGLRKWEALNNAREAAVTAGWLHYDPPPKGTKKPGVYWAIIPERFAPLDDTPIGETHYPANGYGEGDGGGYGEGDGGGYGEGEHSYLRPNPIPVPKKESASEADASRPPTLPAEELLDRLVAAWNALPAGTAPQVQKPRSGAIVKGWRTVQRSREVRSLFADPAAIAEEIRGSPFLHGQGWFRLPWLFARGKTGEWNVSKLLDGAYHQNGNGKHQPTVGPGQRHPDDANRAGF